MLKNILKSGSKHAASKVPKLGLDIGNYSVKMSQIKTHGFGGKEKVLSFSSAAIQGERTPDKVAEAIRQAYRDIGASIKEVNLSICGPGLITRYIILPQMDNQDMAKALDFELEKYVPYKRDTIISEFQVLAQLPNKKNIVLLAAAERAFIQQRVNLVMDAGLVPSSVNIDSLALAEAFKLGVPDCPKTVAVLDIGYRLSKLVVLDNSTPYFSRDLETGEFNITQMISKGMGVDIDAARALQRDPQDKEAEITKIIKTELNSLIDEISLSFEYCERNLEKKVDLLYLTGGGSTIKFLLESLEKIPGLKVNFLDPTFSFKASISTSAAKLKEFAHLLSVAIGLASS